MKKKLLALLLCLTMGLSLMACSGTNEQATEGSGSEEQAVTKLVVWGGVPGESGPQDLVDAFNASHTDIQVEYNRFVNDDTGNTKLDTAIMSGEQIDVFFTYSTDLLKKRVNGGMVEPLESYGVVDFIKENITTNTDHVSMIDDKYYALPTVKEFFGFMINEDMLLEKGVEISDDWTVDEFVEVAKALTDTTGDQTIYGVHPYSGGLPLNFALTVLGGDSYYKNDGNESNFDSKEFAANARIQELMAEGYAMPFEEVFAQKLEMYAHPAFLNEEVAIMPFSTWMLRYVKDLENFPHDFKVTFAAFPTTEAGVDNNFRAYLNNNICMNSKSENKEAAWEFMQYWITEGSEYMLKAGKIPAWSKADTALVSEKILGDNADTLFNAESYARVVMNPDNAYIVDTITTAYPQIVEIYKEESELFFLGETTKDDYLKNLKSRADDAIKAEQ
ncbi:ABC transporter substrate-binding protein [Acidaminobacter sp. JC074]|uniref:ABC transporter substrate-binding protein n=1 Tax=Acidaminobacter sp. JC074 TaxID=2530199 RepID=UPI001F10490B|nr:extracellular solute-binding protein [Acidaminobacter sp. JC074]